nr:auxin-induced protein 15A-like [Tanacetum cinerariifolium]
MLTSKWHTLNANCQKFNAAYKRAKRLGRSGENDVDVLKRAQIDLTGDVPGTTQEDLFGHDARPRPAGKPRPAKKTKSDATASTGGSNGSTQFGKVMEHEHRMKREAAERAFEAQAEKDRTLTRLEELRFLVTSTKDLDDEWCWCYADVALTWKKKRCYRVTTPDALTCSLKILTKKAKVRRSDESSQPKRSFKDDEEEEASLYYSCSLASSKTPPGFFTLYIGEERRRFVVPMGYLSHPVFKMMLEKSSNEFGFTQENGLVVPCSVNAFQEMVSVVESCNGRCDLSNLIGELV